MKNLVQLMIASCLLSASHGHAQSLELVIGTDRGAADDPVVVPVTVDDSSGIIGAAFMISFDTSALSASVTSDFFEPFLLQLEDAESLDDADNFGEIDNVQYDSPIVANLIPGEGLAVSGIRLEPADGSNTTLFHIAFSKLDEETDGSFPVVIAPLSIMNVNAGYPAEGMTVPALVGLDGEDYPALLPTSEFPGASTPGEVNFFSIWNDMDGNGLPDSWEQVHFGAAGIVNSSTDSDGDELRELVEYFLGTNPNIPDSPDTIALQLDAGSYNLFFPMRDFHDITYQVQWSTDANVWNDAGTSLLSRPDLGSGPEWTLAQAVISPGSEQATMLTRIVLQD
ncbi:MAG: hypothetical protein AB3N63_07525 [Puniceicoccaceae bacterium]